eukprot:SAG22_NODE_661_length_8059_cov_14.630402_3_plen_100_part_00
MLLEKRGLQQTNGIDPAYLQECEHPEKFTYRQSNGACHCATNGCPTTRRSNGIAIYSMDCSSGGQTAWSDGTPTNMPYDVSQLSRDEDATAFVCESRVP